MDDIYDFNAGEWGEIVLEESSNNRRKREAPVKMSGMVILIGGLMDLVLVPLLVWMATKTDYLGDELRKYIYIPVLALVIMGVAALVVGYIRVGYKVKPYTILQKGITEGKFRSFEEMPIIELHGPKDKTIVLTRSGSAEKDPKKSVAYRLQTPDEYDFGEFAASLRKFGYGGEAETTTAPPPKDEKKDRSTTEPPKEDATPPTPPPKDEKK